MAKLSFKQEFELEVGEDTYTGVLKELTKEQRKSFEATNKSKKEKTSQLEKKIKQLKKLKRRIEIKEKMEAWADVDTLEAELDTLEVELEERAEEISNPKELEKLYKQRLTLSIESLDLDAILSAGEEHGYQRVFETIIEDISEKKKGK